MNIDVKILNIRKSNPVDVKNKMKNSIMKTLCQEWKVGLAFKNKKS